MALLNWKADYCTGNVKIDDDHRTLFERINEGNDLCRQSAA